MTTFIALIRGINVGRAKRIAMADLRALCGDLGFVQVHTLLNSGNVVLRNQPSDAGRIARTIAEGIIDRFGFVATVVVCTAADLEAIVAGNPLPALASDPSRHLVAFVAEPAALEPARPLLEQDWRPEALVFATGAAHLWCPQGVIESPLAKAFGRVMGDTVTTRNWATVLKLQALAAAAGDG